ncbi:30S ribosomal protein S9 [Candidatus Parcubacteria bacterium]|nr:30S ribosomal protein S9 [Candidatus Parcubacteria bacterium]
MNEAKTQFIETVGRRKAAVARVRLHHGGSGKVTINDRAFEAYLPVAILQKSVLSPFEQTGTQGIFDVTVHVQGGGIRGQADAVRLGIARALVDFNPEYRTSLKKLGFLSRDARVRERKKFGRKSARRSPQWSKR